MNTVTDGKPIPHYTEDNAALLVLDIQEGTTGSLAPKILKSLIRQSGSFITNVNQAITGAQSKNITIIYFCHESDNPILNFFSGGILAKGTPSTAIDNRVLLLNKNVFYKNKSDAFSNRDFNNFLQMKKINCLYIVGQDAAVCVDRTIKGALKRGYAVSVIPEAVISIKAGLKEKMIRDYMKEKVKLIPLQEFY